MKNSYINKTGQVIQPKDLEKTMDEINDAFENPMTTAGDIIVGGASGTPTRLAKGTAGQVLTMNAGATAPVWQTSSGGGDNNGYTVSFENLSGHTVGVLALCSLTENGIVGLQNFDINNNETTTVYKCQYIFRFTSTTSTAPSTYILAKDAQSIVKGIDYNSLTGFDGVETLSSLDVSTVSQTVVYFSASYHSLLIPESNSNLKFVYSQV